MHMFTPEMHLTHTYTYCNIKLFLLFCIFQSAISKQLQVFHCYNQGFQFLQVLKLSLEVACLFQTVRESHPSKLQDPFNCD